MKAAVVSSFGAAPRYAEFPAPAPAGDHDMILDVIAAGLHPRVRSQADGSHYTSTGELPLVPGVDGLGAARTGCCATHLRTRAWALWPSRPSSTPAAAYTAGSDPIAVAAAMNPAMSSWIALRQRVPFQPGQDVLVLGATGNAGRLAVPGGEAARRGPCHRRRARCHPAGRPTRGSLSRAMSAGQFSSRLLAYKMESIPLLECHTNETPQSCH